MGNVVFHYGSPTRTSAGVSSILLAKLVWEDGGLEDTGRTGSHATAHHRRCGAQAYSPAHPATSCTLTCTPVRSLDCSHPPPTPTPPRPPSPAHRQNIVMHALELLFIVSVGDQAKTLPVELSCSTLANAVHCSCNECRMECPTPYTNTIYCISLPYRM